MRPGRIVKVAEDAVVIRAGDIQQIEHEVSLGLVGSHELLRRIVLMAGLESSGATDRIGRRLLLAAYRSESQAAAKAAKVAAIADSYLFASQLPLRYAQQTGLRASATCIQLADGPLTATLLRAANAGADPGKASFDSFARTEVDAALTGLGLATDRADVSDKLASPAAIASYHARLWRLGQTTVAVTCLDEVARRLSAVGAPVMTVNPTDHAIAAAIEVATLLACRRALADSQLAAAVIDVPDLRDHASGRGRRRSAEEIGLAVHALLVRQARLIDASVSRVSEHEFLVIATASSFSHGSGHSLFTVPASAELGVTLHVGIATGRTARAAHDAARLNLRDATTLMADRELVAVVKSADSDVVADRSSEMATATLESPPGGEPIRFSHHRDHDIIDRTAVDGAATAGSLSRLRSLETLARLAQRLAADAVPVVDAELTGQLLSVTPRTARRRLRSLAEQGLALPLPPSRTEHPGRPRHAYRLVVEKLTS